MASRTDQLHSYQFRSRRVLAALVMRETDPHQSPLRRGVGAVFAGVMITVLVSAGVGIYGLLSKVGGDAWRNPGSIVVERETGASYVYLNDTLYPTQNLASAMLAARRPNPTVHRVASKTLSDVARGTPIGIAGAPDSLPAADAQIGLPWTVCARTDADSTGARVARAVLAVGVPVTGGAQLADEGLLVRDADLDATYLVWHGRRHLVRPSRTLVPALFGAAAPTDVATAWLNAVPAGRDIAGIPVAGRGAASAAVPGHANGDVLVVQTGSGPQHYLVFNDGLAPLTPLQLAVIGADQPLSPTEVGSPVVAAVPRSASLPDPREGDPPATPPPLATPGGADLICATATADSANPSIVVGATVAGLDRATPTARTSPGGTPLADEVLVPPGRVSVVRAVAETGAPGGSYLVITDTGIGYPVPDAGVLPFLGYSPNQAVDVPASLVRLVPAGPALDPEAAVMAVAPLG